MPGLIIWKNQEINKLRRDMDRLFDRLWDDFGMPHFTRPSRDIPFYRSIRDKKEHLICKAEIPGLNPEDLDISITNDILTIKGEMKKNSLRSVKIIIEWKEGMSLSPAAFSSPVGL